MPATSDELALYLHLARASERRRRPLVRDKLLVLAAKTAVEMRLDAVAEHCRAKILAHNPGHILRHFDSMADALADEGFQVFFRRLAQSYPRERAEHMLRSLGIQLAGERHVYADDLEYASALLGATPDSLDRPPPLPSAGADVIELDPFSPTSAIEAEPMESIAAQAPVRRRFAESGGLRASALAGLAATLLAAAAAAVYLALP